METPSEPIGVPFKIVLQRILEPAGYTLRRIHGNLRVFDPPKSAGTPLRRIAFEVENGLVRADHVHEIIKIVDEDSKKRQG